MRRGSLALVVAMLVSSCAGASGPRTASTSPAGGRAPAVASSQAATAATAATVARPHIVWKPIPFGAKRKREMAAYSRRHYGTRTWRLTHPHVVVEHYTGSDCFSCAWNTF